MENEDIIKVNTEGVLVLASSKALISKYAKNEFDYNFPIGLKDLLLNHNIIALTTNEGDNINLTINFNINLNVLQYDKVITQYLVIEKDDELLILNHAEFTMICDAKGNYKEYGSPIQFSKSVPKGFYKIDLGVRNTEDEFEKHQAYFRIDINLVFSDVKNKSNNVLDIGN